jgi:hypothetical protein
VHHGRRGAEAPASIILPSSALPTREWLVSPVGAEPDKEDGLHNTPQPKLFLALVRSGLHGFLPIVGGDQIGGGTAFWIGPQSAEVDETDGPVKHLPVLGFRRER